MIEKAAETTDVVVRPLEVVVSEEQVEAEVHQDTMNCRDLGSP